MRSMTFRTTGAALALGGILALTGCGSATESIIENQTGTEIETNEDGIKITDGQGDSFQTGEDIDVPDSWPSNVPLYDGTLTSAIAAGGGVSLIWTTDAGVAEAFDTYSADLESAGFKPVGSGSFSGADGDLRTSSFENDETTVVVVVTDPGKGTTMSVTAAPNS